VEEKEKPKMDRKSNKKNKKKKPARKRGFFEIFILFFMAFTLMITGGIYLLNSVGNVALFGDENPELAVELDTLVDPDSPFYDAFTTSNRVNVLCLGVNSNMADTIMLVSFDMDQKHVDIISVPRDTYFFREGYANPAAHKINAVMPKDGAVGMAKAVSKTLLDIPINYYAVIKYDGIRSIVDAMGGVPIDVAIDMKYKDPYDSPPLVIDLDKGFQTLSGEQSVGYLRFRKGYSNADIGRIDAQQAFVKAAFKQALGKDLIRVIKRGFEEVDSDIKVKTVLAVAAKAIGMSEADMTTYTMPHTLYGEAPWYVIADGEGIEEMITEIYSIQPETTSDGAVTTKGGATSKNTE
jgi:LCP family protein required for cell wall assembly